MSDKKNLFNYFSINLIFCNKKIVTFCKIIKYQNPSENFMALILPIKKIENFFCKKLLFYIEIILLHTLHFTLTELSGNRVNFFEPHFGQIGHERKGFISAQWELYQILL
jgi:hypothetical protein